MTAAHAVNPSASPSSGGASSQCPANGEEVTALRLIDTDSLIAGDDRSFTFALGTSGNAGDDVYTNQAHGTADTILLSPLSPFATTTILGVGELEANKAVALYDPAGTGLYAVPGNDVIYTITVRNIGDGPVDSDSMVVIDRFPPELEYWNGDIDEGGTDSFPGPHPIGFLQVEGTGVSFDPNTDLRYSTATTIPSNFSNCTSIPADNSYRDDVNYVCLNPKGVLTHGSPNPIITLSLRGRIK